MPNLGPLWGGLLKSSIWRYLYSMTDFLFARPSVLEGIGRNIDLFGVMNTYNFSENEAEADSKAMLNDWIAVYGDLYKAYNGMVCQVEAKKTAV
jgi:hypothetical protein